MLFRAGNNSGSYGYNQNGFGAQNAHYGNNGWFQGPASRRNSQGAMDNQDKNQPKGLFSSVSNRTLNRHQNQNQNNGLYNNNGGLQNDSRGRGQYHQSQQPNQFLNMPDPRSAPHPNTSQNMIPQRSQQRTSYGVQQGIPSHGAQQGMSPYGAQQGMPSHGAQQGMSPLGSQQGMSPLESQQGMSPHGSQQGMSPHGAQQGMSPHGAQQGMSPHGSQQGSQQGMSPHGSQQGMSPYGAQQGMPPYGAQQGMPPYGAQQGSQQGMSPYGAQQSMPPYGAPSPPQMGKNGQGMAMAGREQLEAINRGLPDGVTYQPLDMKSAMGPSTIPAIKPDTQNPDKPSAEPVAFNPYGFIEKFIQNERNGAAYYKHLASISPTPEIRKMINDISDCCTRSKNAFAAIYTEKLSKPFEPAEVEINTQISFYEGIRLAIKEESLSLRELCYECEKLFDSKLISFMGYQMHKKTADISFLHLINSKTALTAE